MIKKLIIIFILLTLFKITLAGKLEVDLSSHYGNGKNIKVNYTINLSNDTFYIRAYLKEAKIGNKITSECKIGNSPKVGEIKTENKTGFFYVNFENLDSNLYRIYFILTCENNKNCRYSDCDSGNYYLLKTKQKTKIITIKPKEELIINVINYTDRVYVNKTFTTTISIFNKINSSVKVEVYSYVYNKSKCLSGSWNENKKVIEIPKNTNITVKLNNVIKVNTSGLVNFKIKILSNFTNYTFKLPIEIINYKKVKITSFKETLNSFIFEITNPSKIQQTFSLILLGNNISYKAYKIPPKTTKRIIISKKKYNEVINIQTLKKYKDTNPPNTIITPFIIKKVKKEKIKNISYLDMITTTLIGLGGITILVKKI